MRIFFTDQRRWEQMTFGVLLGALIVFGMGYNIVSPAWRFPDEFGHFDYLHHLLQTGQLPTYEVVTDSWEFHQPPLYYWWEAAGVFFFRFSEVPTQMFVARTMSLLLGLFSVIAARSLFLKIFPGQPWMTAFSTAVVALLPMHVYMMSGVNNDVMANLFGFLLLLALWPVVEREQPTRWSLFLLGVVLGGSLLTKIPIYPVSLMVAGVALWKVRRHPHPWRSVLLVTLPMLAIAGSWWLWNLFTNGHPLGWEHIDAFNRIMLREGWWKTLAGQQTWWNNWMLTLVGRFDYGNIALIAKCAYDVWGYIFFIGLLGQLWWWKESTARERFWVLLSYLITVAVLMEVYIYNINVYQPQGRYWLVALTGIALLAATGWWAMVRSWRPSGQFALLALLIVGGIAIHLQQLSGMQAVYAQRRTEMATELPKDYARLVWKTPHQQYLKRGEGVQLQFLEGEPRVASSAFSLLRPTTTEVTHVQVELTAPESGGLCLTWRPTAQRTFDDVPPVCEPVASGRQLVLFPFPSYPFVTTVGEFQLQFPESWNATTIHHLIPQFDQRAYHAARLPRWHD